MPDEVAGTAVMDRATGAVERDQGRWTTIAVLAAGAFAIGTDMFVVAGMVVGLAGGFGVPVGTAALTVTAFALAYATGAPLLGALIGARPPRQVLIGSLVLFGLFDVMSAVAPTLPVLLAARVLSALAASVYVPAATAAAAAAVPGALRGRALGVILSAASLAMALGAPLGVLLAAILSWRAVFGLVAVLTAITVLSLLNSGVDSGAGPPTRSTVRERLRPMRSLTVFGTLAVTFLVMTGSNSMYTYLAVLSGGARPVGLGLFLGAFGLGGVLGTWWGGSAADRAGGYRAALLAMAVLTAGFAALPLAATTVAGALTAAAAWGIAVWGFVPAQQHRLIRFGVGPAPLMLALNSAATHLGFAAGALLGGLVVDTAGVGSLWLPAVACCGAALMLHAIPTWEDMS